MQGFKLLAYANKARILLAPTPTYISTNSDAVVYKKELFDSPDVAFASIALC